MEQIIEKFALPLDPSQITKASFVNVPAGTKLFAGKANNIFNKTGGGFQFYIDRVQVIEKEWFRKFEGTVQEFLNSL